MNFFETNWQPRQSWDKQKSKDKFNESVDSLNLKRKQADDLLKDMREEKGLERDWKPDIK